MLVDITKDEQQQILACIESAIKSAPNSLQAASILMPLAQKMSQLRYDIPKVDSDASDADS